MLRNVYADANDLFDERPVMKLSGDERPLALSVVEERRRAAEDVLEDLQSDCRLVVAVGTTMLRDGLTSRPVTVGA